ncbi:uncharacterized protein LOC144116352 [Amblyomma americanum]
MEELLKNVPGTQVFLDDVLIAEDKNSYGKTVNKVLEIFRENGIRLRKDKCVFGAQEVTYLGHKIDRHGLHPAEKKLDTIVRAPAPRNVQEHRSFLGLITYYRSFLPNMSTALASPDDEPELWSSRKTNFFLNKYKEMDFVGKTRVLRTRIQLWLKLCELINKKVECNMSPTQVENKWKSLDLAYKKSKNADSSSGHHRVSCEHEEELATILEKEHSVNPRLLLEPGKAILPSGSPSTTGGGPPEDLPVPVEGGVTPKRIRHNRNQLGPLLDGLQKMADAKTKALEARKKWEDARAKRHDDLMKRFDRLIDNLAKQQGSNAQ